VAGAVSLVARGLISVPQALAGIAKGGDIDAARRDRAWGLFDWLAAVATSHAGGSPRRLFFLTYGVGTAVIIFLSNDASAVVLTPAVAAAVKAAKAKDPLPYLLICALLLQIDIATIGSRHVWPSLRQPPPIAPIVGAYQLQNTRWNSRWKNCSAERAIDYLMRSRRMSN